MVNKLKANTEQILSNICSHFITRNTISKRSLSKRRTNDKSEQMRTANKFKSEDKSSSSLQPIIPTSELMINCEEYYEKYNPITKGFMSTLLTIVSMTSINVLLFRQENTYSFGD